MLLSARNLTLPLLSGVRLLPSTIQQKGQSCPYNPLPWSLQQVRPSQGALYTLQLLLGNYVDPPHMHKHTLSNNPQAPKPATNASKTSHSLQLSPAYVSPGISPLWLARPVVASSLPLKDLNRSLHPSCTWELISPIILEKRLRLNHRSKTISAFQHNITYYTDDCKSPKQTKQ